MQTKTQKEVVKTETTQEKPVMLLNGKKEDPSDLKLAQEQELKRILTPTAEQRLRSLEQMKILGDKFSFLKEKQDQLKNFVLSSDGTKEKFFMSNGGGFTFEVTNSQTLEKVLAVIEEDLSLFTARAEQEILSFSI